MPVSRRLKTKCKGWLFLFLPEDTTPAGAQPCPEIVSPHSAGGMIKAVLWFMVAIAASLAISRL